MLFGLIKKHEVADIVFKGGKIYTLDPDAPWAEAVACQDGRIVAVGDEEIIEGFVGEETEIIDLDGRVLLPGFIDTAGHPVLRAFEDACMILYDDMPMDLVLETIAEFVENNPDRAGYFAYGFNTGFVLGKNKEETKAILDKICMDKPIALLDISGEVGNGHIGEQFRNADIGVQCLIQQIVDADREN